MNREIQKGLLNGAAILQPQPGAMIRLPVSAINKMETMRIRAGAEKLEEVLLFALSVYESLQSMAQNDRVKFIRLDGQVQELALRPPRVETNTHGTDFIPEAKPAD